jgi:hypothetical protein
VDPFPEGLVAVFPQIRQFLSGLLDPLELEGVEANNAREARTTRFLIILEQRSKRGVLPSVARLGGSPDHS